MQLVSPRARSIFSHPGVILIPLMGIGAYLRLKGLTFQSFWTDELHTMVETAPQNSPPKIIGMIIHSDPHPPFYFLLIHYWCRLFGYNDYSARFLSVIFGVLAIPAMYFLGKELYNKGAGYIAAVFTTFNYYNIYYSQEARGYTLAFLLSPLSFLFFIRMLRNRSWKICAWYVVFTSLLVYTHYYGLVIFCCQIIIAFILILRTREWKPLLRYAGLPFLLVTLIYSPWVPKMVARAENQKSFWIQKPEVTFIGPFFQEYFAKDQVTICLYVLLLITFLAVGIWKKRKEESEKKFTDRFQFTLLILAGWILGSYLIPYIKSIISMPILHVRYTMVTLPAIISAAAIGTELLVHRWLKISVVASIVLSSLLHLFIFNHYYEKVTKVQWREMSMYLQEENPHSWPIITDRGFQLGYYFSIFHVTPRYVEQDQIPRLHRFWVVTAFHGNPVSPANKAILARDFVMKKSFQGRDCYANFYVKRKPTVSRN